MPIFFFWVNEIIAAGKYLDVITYFASIVMVDLCFCLIPCFLW